MKTIEIVLIKNLVFPEKDLCTLREHFRTLQEYASPDVYDYYKLGGKDILMALKPEVLTKDLIPMLKDLYAEYYDERLVHQREDILHEFEKYDEITWELCENTGHKYADKYYPSFINDAYARPYLMYEEGVKADCTGIVLHIIPPEEATFAALYTLDAELQNKLSSHPLAKALKVCVR